MTTKLLPRLEQFTDYALYNVADDAETVAAAIAHIEEAGISAFLNSVPAYHPSQENAQLLTGWCTSRGVPMSCWNLLLAYRDLTDDGLLELAPLAEQPGVDKWAGVTLARTDALLEYVPSDEESAQLEKVADSPDLNDHQRKARLKKLALLTGIQRRELANLPAHYNEKVVV
jgi:hypothetical protein